MFVDFYIYKNDQQLGPFSKREVFDQILCGKLSENDYCWSEGLDEWVPLKQLELTNPSTWSREEANYVPSSVSKRMRMAQEDAQKKPTKKYSLPVRIISGLMGVILLAIMGTSFYLRYNSRLERLGIHLSFKTADWKHHESCNLLVYSPGVFTPLSHETMVSTLMSPFKSMKEESYGCEHRGLVLAVSKFTSPDITWEGEKKEILIDAIYNGVFSEDPTVQPLRLLWNETKTVQGHEIHSFRYDTEDFKVMDLNVIFEGNTILFVSAIHKPENQDAEFSKISSTLQFAKK